MGLFINDEINRGIYKNKGEITEPNQGFFRRDHLSELLKEQRKVNDALHHSMLGLKVLSEQQGYKQSGQWEEISNQLNELKGMNHQHEKIESLVVERLKGLEIDNRRMQGMLEHEHLTEQEMESQLKSLSRSNQEIADQLKKFSLENDEIGTKMDEQHKLQKKMADQMANQEDKQHEVLNRLDNQEALTEKITRQMEHYRTILFERTTYLAEKIEEGYNLTSSYFTELMTGSDQLPQNFMVLEKKKEEQKSSK